MAKKHPRKSNLKLAVDETILRLYNLGFLHSFVWHMVLLIWLALLYPVLSQKTDRLSPISISFKSSSETIEPELNSFPNIEEVIDIPQENEDSASSTMVSQHTTSIAEHEETSLDSDINPIDLQIPESTEEQNYDKDTLNKEIKGLIPKNTETTKKTSKEKTKSENKQKNSEILGLPESLLAEGYQENTQLIQNMSNNPEPGEIGRRLQDYGAKSGDIQISLAWNTEDDLDLHVTVLPINSQINWMNKTGACGGVLDIDMNFHPQLLNNKPIENIFWEKAPKAEYVVSVHYYTSWTRTREVKATVLIKIDNKTQSFPVVVKIGQPPVRVTTFNR